MRYVMAVLFFICSISSASEKYEIFTEKQIGWVATYPVQFKRVSDEEIAVLENKGAKMIENAIDKKVGESRPKNLLWLEKEKGNAFTSSSEPYNAKTDGPYEAVQKRMFNTIIATFKNTGLRYEHELGTYEIDGLIFQTLKNTLYLSADNATKFTQIYFDRLIGHNTSFLISISYTDEKNKAPFMKIVDTSKFSIRN